MIPKDDQEKVCRRAKGAIVRGGGICEHPRGPNIIRNRFAIRWIRWKL